MDKNASRRPPLKDRRELPFLFDNRDGRLKSCADIVIFRFSAHCPGWPRGRLDNDEAYALHVT